MNAGGVGNCVELVVAHHGPSAPVVDHCLDELKGLALVRAAVDEIADKYGLAPLMLVCTDTRAPPVAEADQQILEQSGAAVDVADDVVPDQ